MRITIDIPDALYRQLMARAAREKRSIKELILQCVERGLRLPPNEKGTPRHPSANSLEATRFFAARQHQDL